mgnify:CR=1 FL=1
MQRRVARHPAQTISAQEAAAKVVSGMWIDYGATLCQPDVFDQALAQAQSLGYAESDPTFDIEGVDAAHKTTIMAAIGFGIPMRFESAYVEGISGLKQDDIRYAEEMGYRIKLLGIARQTDHGVEQRVHPCMVPLAAPIGSGLGIRNPYNLKIIMETVKVPIIVDAGVGTASDAALAMEYGADAVLMNTAIAAAQHPIMMAEAMKYAVDAGRLAFKAGRMPRKLYATASSPIEGML